MSIQLKDQVRHHYRSVDTAQEAVDFLEIVERVEMPVVPGPGPSPSGSKVAFLRRPAVIVAIAFFVVVLAAAPFLFRDPEDPVVASTPPVRSSLRQRLPNRLPPRRKPLYPGRRCPEV